MFVYIFVCVFFNFSFEAIHGMEEQIEYRV